MDKKIKMFRTDNGLEFCEGEFDEFYKNEGSVRRCTIVKTPQYNGYKTLLEKVRCMLFNAGSCKEFWVKVVNTACWLIFRSPCTTIDCETSEEVWSDKPADYSS